MIKYVGKGAYYQGVPARDLSDDEWKSIPRRVQKKVLDLGLFEIEKPKRISRKPKDEPQEELEE